MVFSKRLTVFVVLILLAVNGWTTLSSHSIAYAQNRQTGTVTTAILNLRSGPGTAYPVVGKLKQGDSVEIVDKQSGWLQIVAPGVSGGKAWVTAQYVRINSQSMATTAPTPVVAPGTVPAPTALDYIDEVFTWKWSGADGTQGKDWYFDLQFYHPAETTPYKVVVVEVSDTTLANGVYSFSRRANADCESKWVVQIATRQNRRFVGWVSPKSNRLEIGGLCKDNPEAVPTPPNGDGCQGASCGP